MTEEEFLKSLEENQAAFGVHISPDTAAALAKYFLFLESKNDVLHLVAPCSAEEFAVRHILESIFAAARIPKGATLADVGTGGGLPGIPLAIYRGDLRVVLIESKQKKARFLEETLNECGLEKRVRVENRQFEEAPIPAKAIVTARALDKFPSKLPRLAKWAGTRKLLLFGGPGLEEALTSTRIRFRRSLIPMSERRFLFEVGPS